MRLRSLGGGSSALAGHVDYLAYRQPQVFSAITVFRGARRIIVHNDAHAPVRQRSDLAHELAHALLMHAPHPPFCSDGQRTYDRRLEAEAGWLGPVLLVTNEAARWAAAQGMDAVEAAQHFGVSVRSDALSYAHERRAAYSRLPLELNCRLSQQLTPPPVPAK